MRIEFLTGPRGEKGTMTYQRREAAVWGGILILVSVAAMALSNRFVSKRAEADNLPEGEFMEVQGVRLHYIVIGSGPSVLFLHGNGSMIGELLSSGIIAAVAANSRVILFDRPGFGHSSRPEGRSWTPEDQAALFAEALARLQIEAAVVVGHSWGTLVALALALRYPGMVQGLVLASGYYFPTPRPDIVLASIGAIPGVGTLLCHTLLPIIGRINWPMIIKKLFSPCEVPPEFLSFPKEMALRPSQLRASSQENAMMVPSTEGLADRCRGLSMPAAIMCGAGDQLVDPKHSARLQNVIADSELSTVLFNGHMVHHTAPGKMVDAIEGVKRRARAATG